ncbi:2-oxo-4-hydroxy-4-carboxy-5-ureidoimidazoline decarboxylase [Beijerinckia sp. L45]|uniref:2-oxo-4-hydroxy-4-carboxy-5-ureidoimidazoline decarboxylase n=1 Tax=Beijerinckia sp. L45 TaxID=1641855 RepID=UPI00131C4935|nr:2-oxo-4-hydroxy-4-carboxy-5-ureidoimidazoline decarboxylase [Beijerinckia sp. L45]
MTDAELAALDRSRFIAAFGDVFEHSAWIAEAAWAQAPFHSMAALHAAMVAVLDAAGTAAAIALVRAHPDLAGKAALAGELTADSRTEQATSGLSSLTAAELAQFQRLNDAYREKFGFPFVMAVRRSDKHAILAAFAERLDNDPDMELARALSEIQIIAQLRLDAIAAA